MQVQRQSRRYPAQVLVLMLALVAASLVGGSAGYQLREHGYFTVNAASAGAPATVPVHRVPVSEPDGGDRTNRADSAPAGTPPAGDESTTHGPLP